MRITLGEILNTDLARLLRWMRKGVDVDFPLQSVTRMRLVSEDILGPVRHSLVVDLETGESRSFEGKCEIGKFAEHAARRWPELADRVAREVKSDRPTGCWEVLLYEKNSHLVRGE